LKDGLARYAQQELAGIEASDSLDAMSLLCLIRFVLAPSEFTYVRRVLQVKGRGAYLTFLCSDSAVFITVGHACREFLLANYAEIKKANPGFPVLIRECAGAEAKLVARFDKGVEKTVSIQGDSPAAIEKKLIGLTN
jgi:hypothetical protein